MNQSLQVTYVSVEALKPADYNPRKWDESAIAQLKESIQRFGLVDPIIVNSADNRKNVVIGGHFRLKIARDLDYKEIPVIYVNISDIEKEKELNLRLNKNLGSWDYDLLSSFDESFLSDIGFSSEEIDDIFPPDEHTEEFDLNKELEKLDITQIVMQKGDIWQLGDHKLMVGDSTIEEDVLRLMKGEKASLCLCDPPYRLSYLSGKHRHGTAVTGFGAKRDRRYLETDILPPDFTEKWMANVHKIQDEHFSIIVFENWKNLREVWGVMEKYWKVRNMIVWHIPNRHQGFASKYKFFSKYDIAMVGASPSEDIEFNNEAEEEGLQEEYETALYATSGAPTWESYEKGKKVQPTDFIEFIASDEKSSGQGIVFGTKPVEILLPYVKVLTKRGDIIIETFGGAGSTLITAEKLRRRCFLMEKSAVYSEVIKTRWEKFTGKKAVKIS